MLEKAAQVFSNRGANQKPIAGMGIAKAQQQRLSRGQRRRRAPRAAFRHVFVGFVFLERSRTGRRCSVLFCSDPGSSTVSKRKLAVSTEWWYRYHQSVLSGALTGPGSKHGLVSVPARA